MAGSEPFEGADEIRRAWLRGLAPDPALTVSQWADRHRMLSSRAASEAGPYRTARTPYMRAIMDALSPSDPATRVVFMKSAQVGATEVGNNWIGFAVHRVPAPILAVQPTVDMAKRLSQQRLDPLFEDSPVLRDLIAPSRTRDSGNTMLSKKFQGGQLILAGATVPRLYGVVRAGGNIIWATDFREEVSKTKQGGKGGGGGAEVTEYKYYASFAVAICEGEIGGIGRIWADGDLLDTSKVEMRWYPGNETQEPDPLIARFMGANQTPAYRGTAYVVIDDMLLTDFGNRIPQLTFEVFRPVADPDSAEGLVPAVTMIPGTGEFSYGTSTVRENVGAGLGGMWKYALDGFQTPLRNENCIKGKPDALVWVFRYKDIRSWWSNQHFNRPGGVESGSPTAWVPQSKPIWFTELGCPAVDRGTNQPNVFHDPKSSESFVPYFSRGWRDDRIQRAYLEAVYSYWSDPANNPVASGYGGRMVNVAECAAWTWDVRPFPFFPNFDGLWKDSQNWRLGHWLTGRLGSVSLAALVRSLCRFVAFEVVSPSASSAWPSGKRSG